MQKSPPGYYACITLIPKIAFAPLEDDRAKAYMHNRIVECAPVFGANILAYYIGPDKVSLALFNTEGNKAALMDYAECLNGEFSQYYNQTFEKIGMVFRESYTPLHLKGVKKIKDCINYLHHACENIGQSISDYAFSSYLPYLNRYYYLTNAYSLTFNKPFEAAEFVHLHSLFKSKIDYTIPPFEKLKGVLAEGIKPFGTQTAMTKSELGKLIADASIRTGVSFEQIYKKLKLPIEEKDDVLLHSLLELTLQLRYPFFDAAEILQIEDFTDQLAFDLIDQIIEKTGYSVQYTKYFLGL